VIYPVWVVDVSTRQLRSFVVLAEELSFTRAAERLGIAQQALSGQLRRLEDRIGVLLFERSTRRVVLTEAGTLLLSGANLALGTLDRAVASARERDLRDRRTLRVGYIEDVARELTEPILRIFRESQPSALVQLLGCDYTDPSCGLRDGSADIAFVRLPIATEGLTIESIFSEPLMLGIHANHPLARRPSVDMQEVLELPLVVPATNDHAWRAFWTLEHYFEGTGASPAHEVRALVRTASGELQAVSAGSGCALVPSGALRLHGTQGIAIVPINDGPASELALAWRTDDKNEFIPAFRTAVHDACHHHPELMAIIEARPSPHHLTEPTGIGN
jgi:DNA-binding transcriptional LysR family regulator